MIVFAVNSGCNCEMSYLWMAGRLGKPFFCCRVSKYDTDCLLWGNGNFIGHVERMDPGIPPSLKSR